MSAASMSKKDQTKLKVIEDRMRDVERQAEIKYPTPGAGMKLVGARPAG